MILQDWFTYSSISKTYNNDLCHWITFHDCQIQQPIAQFDSGTKFTFIKLNENGVMVFNIYDKNRPNLFEAPGYNYLGYFWMTVDQQKYHSLLGYWGFCYSPNYQNIKFTKGGFKLQGCKAHERTPNLFNNEFIDKIKLDFIHNKVFINHDAHEFQIHLALRPEAIQTSYLESELEKGNISQSEFNETKSRRSGFNFDVQVPNSP